jgi:hypothetical protein
MGTVVTDSLQPPTLSFQQEQGPPEGGPFRCDEFMPHSVGLGGFTIFHAFAPVTFTGLRNNFPSCAA